ncbi:hypothetical protein PR048_027188 [Dryococelus australis]|uniref:Uncharacterized protein n=1 Tax=Dryococelus australis TaxID=614101 RepID=A0ABQ9GF92_9NEOP|nr:hypothetical protein PR048_027188 [Dryococelus australis]
MQHGVRRRFWTRVNETINTPAAEEEPVLVVGNLAEVRAQGGRFGRECGGCTPQELPTRPLRSIRPDGTISPRPPSVDSRVGANWAGDRVGNSFLLTILSHAPNDSVTTVSRTSQWRRNPVRLLASHQGEPGSIPGQATTEFSQVGIVPDDAAGRWVFSGISLFPRPFIPALLHISITLIGSQYLDVKSHPNLLFWYLSVDSSTTPNRGKGRYIIVRVTLSSDSGRAADEVTTCIQVDLTQGVRKCHFYREQPITIMRLRPDNARETDCLAAREQLRISICCCSLRRNTRHGPSSAARTRTSSGDAGPAGCWIATAEGAATGLRVVSVGASKCVGPRPSAANFARCSWRGDAGTAAAVGETAGAPGHGRLSTVGQTRNTTHSSARALALPGRLRTNSQLAREQEKNPPLSNVGATLGLDEVASLFATEKNSSRETRGSLFIPLPSAWKKSRRCSQLRRIVLGKLAEAYLFPFLQPG